MPDLAANQAGAQFQSLYRRYRPQRFDEVRGQDHITLALRNAVRENRVAHAYLFSGPRGTGKTSTARILGKALNCTALVDGEPCGTCDSCVSIASGNSFDVHELDAASNNGVEAMRDLVARSSLATPGRWKVYIVDEVHMLSTAASNALLKTLEEPPDHVVFVLATTDPQKVIATIRSRTQQYEFHLMADDVLAGLVEDIAISAGLSLPEGAATQAVRRGRGSARDTLSVLDQVAASGVIDDDSGDLAHVVRAIAHEDGTGALTALDGAVRQGRDPQQIAVDLVELLRAGFLLLVGAPSVAAGIARIPADELEVLRSLGLARCVRGMELIGTAIVNMRDAPEPRITLEIAVYRAASIDGDSSVDALLERIERLERRVEGLSAQASAPAPSIPIPPPRPTDSPTRMVGTPAGPPDVSPEVRQPPSPATSSDPVRPSDPASPPAGPPSGSRPALGAFRQTSTTTPRTDAPSPPPQGARPTDLPAPNERPRTAPGRSDRSSDAPPDAQATGAPLDGPRAPDRDAFVLAWGDGVLTGLRPRTRMLYNVGHFIAADAGVGVFALPNAFHVQMAEAHRDEVAEALSAYLGVAVTVRLVVEDRGVSGDDGTPVTDGEGPPTAGPSDEVEERVSLDDVGEPVEDEAAVIATGVEWATDRIRTAFPGAEEVSP